MEMTINLLVLHFIAQPSLSLCYALLGSPVISLPHRKPERQEETLMSGSYGWRMHLSIIIISFNKLTRVFLIRHWTTYEHSLTHSMMHNMTCLIFNFYNLQLHKLSFSVCLLCLDGDHFKVYYYYYNIP